MALLIAFLIMIACGQEQPTVPAGPKLLPLSGVLAEASGKLLFDRPGTWTTFEPRTQQINEIATFPEQTFPSTPAVSPDGRTVAFSLFSYGTGPSDPAYGTDLFLMQPDGTQQQPLLAHAAPGETLTEPAWSADGSTISFTVRSPTGEQRIERVNPDGSERSVVVERGQSPTLSADGQHLVYVDPGTQGQPQLMIALSDGSNPQPLLRDNGFQQIAAPRFAPQGNQIVFAAVVIGAVPPPVAQENPNRSIFAGLRPRVARAHGVPWELWVVNADGSDLRQITDLQEDFPIPTWSPDGAWIGFKGELGLYVADPAGKQVRRVAEDVAASIAWLP